MDQICAWKIVWRGTRCLWKIQLALWEPHYNGPSIWKPQDEVPLRVKVRCWFSLPSLIALRDNQVRDGLRNSDWFYDCGIHLQSPCNCWKGSWWQSCCLFRTNALEPWQSDICPVDVERDPFDGLYVRKDAHKYWQLRLDHEPRWLWLLSLLYRRHEKHYRSDLDNLCLNQPQGSVRLPKLCHQNGLEHSQAIFERKD